MALNRRLAAAAFGVLAMGGIGAGVANAATTNTAPPPSSSTVDTPPPGTPLMHPVRWTPPLPGTPLTHPLRRVPTAPSRVRRAVIRVEPRWKTGPQVPPKRVTDTAG